MNRKSLLVIAIAMLLAGLLVFAFIQGRAEFAKEKLREAPIKTASRVSTVNHEAVVTLDAATLAQSGITLATLAADSTPVAQRAYAVVLPVQDLVDARTAYGVASAQIAKTQAAVDLARQEYQRLDRLHSDDRNVSDKALQAGAAALAAEQANLQAARVALQSSRSGVEQRYGPVVAGWLADDAAPLRRLLQQQLVLLQVTPASAAAGATPPASIGVQVGTNQLVPATFVARAPRTDPRVQGIGYLYVAAAQALVPGMNVLALLPTELAPGGVRVPASAAVWWQGTSWLYVQRGPGQFARVEVRDPQPTPDGFVVHGGVTAGDQVVARGAQLLLSEEFRSQVQVGDEGGAK